MPTPTLELLHNDDNYVAILKPPGLAVIPGRAEPTSALEILANQLSLPWTGQADPRLRVVHRMDKDTSGVLLFAKNLPAQRHASNQFQNNLIEKEYLALVRGKVEADEGEINEPLAISPTSKLHMAVTKHGRPARTLWKVEQRFKLFTLLRIFPKTGKTHQIRVHMLHIGHPLVVDPLYNPIRPGQLTGLYLSSFKRNYRIGHGDERPLIQRLTLHAHILRFTNLAGEKVELTAPLPKDFRAAINQLSRHGA